MAIVNVNGVFFLYFAVLVMDSKLLLQAITDNRVSDLAALQELAVDVNRPVFCDTHGEAILPISYACAKGSIDIVKHLLQLGVDINIPGKLYV